MSGNAQYPSLSCLDETISHLMHCPHPLLKSKLGEIVSALRKKGLKSHVLWAFLDVISSFLLGSFTHNTVQDRTQVF